MNNNQDTASDKAQTIANLRALASKDMDQTIFSSRKNDNIDTETNYESANAVFQSASESELMEKAAVLNINKDGDLTIPSCFYKHSGGKWLAMETSSSGNSFAVQVKDRAKSPKGDEHKIPSTSELLKSTAKEDMMRIISSADNRVTQEVFGTVIVDWTMIQGIFLSPNSSINSQDILWHYVNLAKSDKTLADFSWFNRICNVVLQVELAQHDSIKTTGLETNPIRPNGKNHLKTIKDVTNEFDPTTNESDNQHSDTARIVQKRKRIPRSGKNKIWQNLSLPPF